MPADNDVTHRLRVLRQMLDRWVAEHARLASADPVWAQHHAEGIDDLRQTIARLERAGGTSTEPDHES
jgi:hypothetical protein